MEPVATVRTRPLLVALVAILAIALAAGTLNSAVAPDGSVGAGGEGGLGGGAGADEGAAEGEEGDRATFGFTSLGGALPVIPLPCYPLLNDPRVLLGGLLVVGVGLYLLYRRDGPLTPIAVVAAFGPPTMLVHALLTACRQADEVRVSLPLGNRTTNITAAFGMTSGSGGGGAAAGGTPVVSLLLFGVLGVAFVVAVALLFRSTGDHAPATTAESASPEEARMEAIGRAAGRAADRIEGDADADNAVYRAWKEMTGSLDVPNPAASTPAEFADAAVEAGMTRGDVAELTGLFESVRYGTAAPTDDRESRAVAALRRIEDAYAGDGP